MFLRRNHNQITYCMWSPLKGMCLSRGYTVALCCFINVICWNWTVNSSCFCISIIQYHIYIYIVSISIVYTKHDWGSVMTCDVAHLGDWWRPNSMVNSSPQPSLFPRIPIFCGKLNTIEVDLKCTVISSDHLPEMPMKWSKNIFLIHLSSGKLT